MGFVIAGCGATRQLTGRGPSVECASHPQPDRCEQALVAVIAELGDRRAGGRIRIDPVQCANGACWTWAYLSPAAGGREQQLSVDWGPNGKISVGYVVP